LEIDDDHLAILDKILVPAPSGPVKANEVICILLHPYSPSQTESDEPTTTSSNN
jgi:hypothetical protein